MRAVLPLGNGGVAHLFVIYGCQGPENDPLAEAKMCCTVQLVMLMGDLNADPSVISSLGKSISDGQVDLEKAFAP